MSDPLGKHVSVGAPQVFPGAFDFQLVRAMGTQTYGGAEVGECLSTARKITNNDAESWYTEWEAIGSRVAALGDGYLTRGDRVSAREAFQRANSYYRSAEFSSNATIRATAPPGKKPAAASRRQRPYLIHRSRSSRFRLRTLPCLPISCPAATTTRRGQRCC